MLVASFAILSFVGSLLLASYLVISERSAPSFSDSPRGKSQRSIQEYVSIIVPARNEEQDIGRCLDSLLKQSYRNLEIIIVDDSSNDGTLKVAEKFSKKCPQITAIAAGAKPDGWVGKSWPCWRGYEQSKGSYLLFVDADSTLDSSIVESSLEYVLEKQIDMFSLSPKVELHGFVSKAVLPMISGAINILYPMKKVNDKKSDRAYMFGTFMLVRREAYAEFGGHARVKGEIVEDAAIARAAKKSGFNLKIEKGLESISTLWEKEASSVYDGLERIISSSVKTFGLVSILNAVLIFFIAVYPLLFIIVFLISLPQSSILLLGFLGSLANVATMLALAGLETRSITGKIGISTALYPLGCTVFILAIVSTSIKLTRGRTIRWKEQNYVLSLQR